VVVSICCRNRMISSSTALILKDTICWPASRSSGLGLWEIWLCPLSLSISANYGSGFFAVRGDIYKAVYFLKISYLCSLRLTCLSTCNFIFHSISICNPSWHLDPSFVICIRQAWPWSRSWPLTWSLGMHCCVQNVTAGSNTANICHHWQLCHVKHWCATLTEAI